MKMHCSDRWALHDYNLWCQKPFMLTIVFTRLHLLSMVGVRVGLMVLYNMLSWRELLLSYDSGPVFFYNTSAGNQQGTQLTKRRRCNTGSLKRGLHSNAEWSQVVVLSFHAWWLPGETTGFFRLSLSRDMPFSYSWSVFQLRETLYVTLALGSYPSEDDGRAPGLSLGVHQA